MEIAKEIWQEVEGYSGIYFVSNFGSVKSVDHFCEGRTGSGKQTGRLLKAQKCYKGYLRVSLSFNKKKKAVSVHRLVAKAFIPNNENKPQVNHINGIKDDNRVENLEWCNNSENQIHAVKTGLCNPNYGEKHYMAKLSNENVGEAISLHKSGFKNIELAKKFNVSAAAMSKILKRETYINI